MLTTKAGLAASGVGRLGGNAMRGVALGWRLGKSGARTPLAVWSHYRLHASA